MQNSNNTATESNNSYRLNDLRFDDGDLCHINSICKWYWKQLIFLLKDIEKSKPTIEIILKEHAETMLEAIENISSELERRNKYLIAYFRDRFKKLKSQTLDCSSSKDSEPSDVAQTSKLIPKVNLLSLKKNEQPVYTDDELNFLGSFETDIDPINKVQVALDDYILVFKENRDTSLCDTINIVNDNGDTIKKDEKCYHKDAEQFKIISNCLEYNEQFKIKFLNINCLIKRQTQSQDVQYEEKSVNFSVGENNESLDLNISKTGDEVNNANGNSQDQSPIDKVQNLNTNIKSEIDSDPTVCSEVLQKFLDDATEILSYSDKHSDDSDKKDNDFNTNCNDAVVDDNVKSTEELIAILEDLLSEDTFEEDESDSDSDSEISYNIPKKSHIKGRVVNNDILSMRRQMLITNETSCDDCVVKLERSDYIEGLVKQLKDEIEVNRLTNLNTLDRHTERSENETNNFLQRRTKKKARIIESTSSDSDDHNNLPNNQTPELPPPSPPQSPHNSQTNLNIEQLEILNSINSGNEVEESKSASDGNGSLLEVANIVENNSTKEGKRKKYKKKSKWLNDPLLTNKLNLTSDSDSSSGSGIVKKKARIEIKLNEIDKCDNSNIPSTSKNSTLNSNKKSSSSSSSCNPDTDSDSSNPSSSDVDLVEEYVNISSESDNENNTQGRRNIRALITDDILTDATKLANKEEQERKMRLIEKEKQLKNYCSQTSCTPEETLALDVDKDFKPLIAVHPKLVKRMKPHQKEGVKFMWKICYESINQLKIDAGSGCVIAHCMGLGKTFQVVTLVHTLLTHAATNTRFVLIVCPLSTVLNWKNEFKIGLEGFNNVNVFTISDLTKTKAKRLSIVDKWWKLKGVLIMGYEAYLSLVRATKFVNTKRLQEALVNPGPDLFVVDEGHLLKNNKTHKCKYFSQIATKRRIILTGTPLQNNLKEYYHMVQFIKPNLLGSYREFTNRFVNPITNGQFHDSNSHDIHLMKKRSHVLHKLLENTVQRYEASELQMYLPSKKDYVLFIRLAKLQATLYKQYISLIMHNDNIKKETLFQHYHNLQMVWNHPMLLNLKEKQDSAKKPKEVDTINLDPDIKEIPLPTGWWKDTCPKDLLEKIEYGSKFLVAKSILEECSIIKDKVLIFSSSLIELDALEYFLKEFGTKDKTSWKKDEDYYRLDGTVPPDSRIYLCNKFNDPKETVKVFLISHKVGGLGLNLVAANRVILMDVSWNPSYDAQSIFRTYRFGQTKECFVYRLVSKGTLEDTIYVRAINKLAISGRVVDERQISRHYKSKDLEFLYQYNDDSETERPIPKVPHDNLLAILLNKHPKEIYEYHEHQSLLENLPHEELDEEEMKIAWEEFNKEQEAKEEQTVVPPASVNELNKELPMIEKLKMRNVQIINSIKNLVNQSNVNEEINSNSATSTLNKPNSDVIIIED